MSGHVARRRMYGTCRRCGYRRLVNNDGRIRAHRQIEGLHIGQPCAGGGSIPDSCGCRELDCWTCQIEGPLQ